MENFLWNCPVLGKNELWQKLPIPLIRSEMVLTRWMLSRDRTERGKEEVSDIVIKRWSARCKKIQKGKEKEKYNQLADDNREIATDDDQSDEKEQAENGTEKASQEDREERTDRENKKYEEITERTLRQSERLKKKR